MIFKLMLSIVIIIPTIFGLYMLLTPGEKLVNAAKQGTLCLPMPAPDTKWFKILVGFYRFLGVVTLAFAVFLMVKTAIKP